MHAFVCFATPDGGQVTLMPGDFVGRASSATLILDDGRISEAHAMVSLRGAELRLLSLRGRFAVDGNPSVDAALAPGQVVSFAAGVDVTVVAVELPPTLTALRGPGLPNIVLHGTASLTVGPPARLVPRFDAAADARIWLAGDRWRVAVGDGEPTGIEVGAGFEVAGRSFELIALPVDRAGVPVTELSDSAIEPLRIVADVDSVQLHRPSVAPVLIGGIAGQLVGLLATAGCAMEWDTVAAEVWRAETDRNALRRRFDVVMVRLRARLRGAGIRSDLVASNGAGLVELLLYPGDEVVVSP